MALKENLVDWYIKNVIIPNFVKYDSPGFVVTEQTSKFGYTFQRDIFLSENFITDLENKFVEKYGDQGKIFLYGVGKNFGWNYGKSFNMPTIQANSNKDVIEMAQFLASFVGSTWADRSEITKMELNFKSFEIQFTDYVVCSKNGLGYLLNEGGIAGLWAWLMADFSIEGIQIKCQGRKENGCRTLCAPSKSLKEKQLPYVSFYDKIESNSATDEYLTFNKIRPTQFSNTTIKKLIANNIVTYSNGKMEYNKERYLPLGIDFLFLLESQAKKIPKGSDLLFETACIHGKRIAKKEEELTPAFISDFMAFQGWGDLLITPNLNELAITYYPWHELFDQCEKEIFLGLLSGFVSIYKKKEIKLRIASSSLSEGFVRFNLEEAQ